MLQLTRENPIISMLSGPPAEMVQAGDLLTYYPKGFAHNWQYRTGQWDGRQTMLTQDGLFLAGLEHYLIQSLQRRGITVNVPDFREFSLDSYPSLAVNWDETQPGPLRPYQQEALITIAAHKRGVVWMATGTGKTEVIAATIHHFQKPTVVFVHTKDLMRQMTQRLSARLRLPVAQIGQIGGGEHRWAGVTVAMIQSVGREVTDYQEDLARVAVLISDEAHHVPAPTWQAVMGACRAPVRLAFSGTPYTDDQVSWQGGVAREYLRERFLLLTGATGPLIYKYATEEAVAAGTILRPTVHIIDHQAPRLMYPDTAPPPAPQPQIVWSTLRRLGIVECDRRNQAIVTLVRAAVTGGRSVIVNVNETDHVQRLAQALADVPVFTMTGSDPVRTRTARLKQFAESSRGVLIGTSLLNEGIDLRTVSMVVLAAGGQAQHLVQQRVGRGQRKDDRPLVVVDFADHHHPVLRRHALARQRYFAEQQWPTQEVVFSGIA